MAIQRKRLVAAVLITAGLTLAPASAAFAGGGDHHVPGCNSGNGNGSEGGTPECDPGNSGGVNNGGD
jgi:hypothetical protein